MFSTFGVALVVLGLVVLACLIQAFNTEKLVLVLFVPVIAIAAANCYISYDDLLGYPVELEWNELPSTITVIYFDLDHDVSITLFLKEDDTTRIVQLPWLDAAEDALEGERESMGDGEPSTFETTGGQGEGEGGEGDGDGDGEGGGGDGGGGWNYQIQSRGSVVVPGTLPPK